MQARTHMEGRANPAIQLSSVARVPAGPDDDDDVPPLLLLMVAMAPPRLAAVSRVCPPIKGNLSCPRSSQNLRPPPLSLSGYFNAA